MRFIKAHRGKKIFTQRPLDLIQELSTLSYVCISDGDDSSTIFGPSYCFQSHSYNDIVMCYISAILWHLNRYLFDLPIIFQLYRMCYPLPKKYVWFLSRNFLLAGFVVQYITKIYQIHLTLQCPSLCIWNKMIF